MKSRNTSSTKKLNAYNFPPVNCTLDINPKPVTIIPVMKKVKNYQEAMLRYFYAPVIGFALVLAIVCGFVIGFDEVWRYWRVAALNL